MEFNQGFFQNRIKLPDNLLGELKEVHVPPAPDGSFSWYLSQANLGNLILDLRQPIKNPKVEQWLNSTQIVYLAGWVFWETDFISEVELRKHFDGIIFIKKTTPTRPTSNDLKTVARREGF